MSTEQEVNDVSLLDIPDDELDSYIQKIEADLANTQDSNATDEVETEEPTEAVDDDSNVEQTEEDDSLDEEDTSEESLTEEDNSTTEEVKSDSKPEQRNDIDYKAAYEKVLAPFNANGKSIQVDSIDDAVRLMQMGANYNKKMADIKPHLKIVKMLDNNGLLDESKLNLLIDVAKGDKEAIKKVFSESGIDPYELDAEKDKGYAPKNHQVNESEIDLDMVIEELQSSPSFNKTANIIQKDLDTKSKEEIAKNPNILRVLNDHVESGMYDKISAEVAKRKALGRLPVGLPELEYYGQVAAEMTQNQQVEQPQQAINQPVQNPMNQRKEEERQAKRKAVAPTKKVVNKQAPVVDILNMSDDEIAKLSVTDLFKIK